MLFFFPTLYPCHIFKRRPSLHHLFSSILPFLLSVEKSSLHESGACTLWAHTHTLLMLLLDWHSITWPSRTNERGFCSINLTSAGSANQSSSYWYTLSGLLLCFHLCLCKRKCALPARGGSWIYCFHIRRSAQLLITYLLKAGELENWFVRKREKEGDWLNGPELFLLLTRRKTRAEWTCRGFYPSMSSGARNSVSSRRITALKQEVWWLQRTNGTAF